MEAFSDSLRREMRRFGVHVALIEPGPIATPIWKKSVLETSVLRKSLSEEVMSLYGDSINKVEAMMIKAVETAAPVSAVVKAVEHALLARKPRTRYPVGKGISFMTKMSNLLPDTWMDQLLRARSQLRR